MNEHYRDTRKIDPTRGATLADGSPMITTALKSDQHSSPFENGRSLA